MLYIGVDPGSAHGGIAFYRVLPCRRPVMVVHELPTQKRITAGRARSEIDAYSLADIIRSELRAAAGEEQFALIEKVGPMPHDSKIAAASFVGASREIRGVLRALNVCTAEITVPAWRKLAGVPKCVSGDKGPLVTLARELWPELSDVWKLKKNINQAEAALIALACYRKRMELCGKS